MRPVGGDHAEVLTADLVVDATGRSGRTPARLKHMGYDPSAEDQVRVDITYASRHLRLRPAALGDPDRINKVANSGESERRGLSVRADVRARHVGHLPDRQNIHICAVPTAKPTDHAQAQNGGSARVLSYFPITQCDQGTLSCPW